MDGNPDTLYLNFRMNRVNPTMFSLIDGYMDGLFSLVFDSMPEDSFYVMDDKGGKVRVTSDMIAASAAYLSRGGEIGRMGSRVEIHNTLSMWKPTVDEYSIRGAVIFVDGFGNLVTNIQRELIEQSLNGRTFEIVPRNNQYTIKGVISESYQDVTSGDSVALVNESGFIELAIHDGSAAQLLGLHFGDIVRWNSNDNPHCQIGGG